MNLYLPAAKIPERIISWYLNILFVLPGRSIPQKILSSSDGISQARTVASISKKPTTFSFIKVTILIAGFAKWSTAPSAGRKLLTLISGFNPIDLVTHSQLTYANGATAPPLVKAIQPK